MCLVVLPISFRSNALGSFTIFVFNFSLAYVGESRHIGSWTIHSLHQSFLRELLLEDHTFKETIIFCRCVRFVKVLDLWSVRLITGNCYPRLIHLLVSGRPRFIRPLSCVCFAKELLPLIWIHSLWMLLLNFCPTYKRTDSLTDCSPFALGLMSDFYI